MNWPPQHHRKRAHRRAYRLLSSAEMRERPMDGEQWAKVSTRGALIAQLRGQCRAGTMMLEEIACLRELLRPIWQRTFAQTWRLEIPDDHWFKVGMTAGELRAIAALFVELDE